MVTVFWIPPTSPLCSSGTDDTVTLPDCEASAPTLKAGEQHRPGHDPGPGTHLDAATMITMPVNRARNSIWTTRRGEACGKTLGTPAAASSSVMDSGSSRTPVAIAESPSATDKNSGTAKNRPACSRYCRKNDVSPPAGSGSATSPDPAVRRRRGRYGGSPTTRRPTARPRRRESARSRATAPATREHPPWAGRGPTSRSGGSVHDEAEAERRQPGAHQVEPRSLLGRGFCYAAGERQDNEHHEDFTDEHPPPGGIGGEQAADRGPAATAIAPAEATSPYARGR